MQRGFLGASSERSWQSNSPSHSHFFWLRQRPLAQRNSSGPHVGYSTSQQEDVYHKTTTMKCCGMNFWTFLPDFLFQDSSPHTHSPHSGDSSEPSEQSMSWSHTKCLGIHRLFWQPNSFSSQVLLVYTGNGKHTFVNGHGTLLAEFLFYFV